MRFSIEPFSRWRSEAAPLFDAHWREIARHQERFALDMDWARYELLEKSGALFCVTAREGWTLTGYAVFIVGPHLHYKQMKVAALDIIFVAEAYRAHGWAYKGLIQHCDERLRELGADLSIHRVKVAHDFSPLLERLGYTWIEKTHEKVL